MLLIDEGWKLADESYAAGESTCASSSGWGRYSDILRRRVSR